MRLWLLTLLLAAAPLAAAPTATTLPAQPLIERTRDAQHLNFDLVFATTATRPWN